MGSYKPNYIEVSLIEEIHVRRMIIKNLMLVCVGLLTSLSIQIIQIETEEEEE
jgi:hypothetical protein